ncbi:acyltransferase family protein [Alsobacter sp. SYSU BS001988]
MSYPVVTILIGVASAYLVAILIATMLSRTNFPLAKGEGRIGCIDGLRGYLAISVLAHHFIIWMQTTRLGGTWTPPTIFFFNQLGTAGVALFFMTTGFVFYPRVLVGFKRCSWVAIYTTRLFRIVPLIIVSVFIITAVIAMRTGRGPDSSFPVAAAKWISTWGEPPLLHYPDSGRLNAYVLWSLWYEWLFYLFVLPVCALAMDLMRGRLPSWVLPVALLTMALAARVVQLPISMTRYLPLFAIGMLAYECQRRERIVRVLRTPRIAIAAACALGIGMVAAPTPYEYAAPFFGFFFVCVACGNSMGGLLRTKGALVLGECSYGIYLLHGIILSVLFVDAAVVIAPFTTEQLPMVLPLAVIPITLITALTYILVERPAIRAGGVLAKRWTGRRLRSDAAELEVAP